MVTTDPDLNLLGYQLQQRIEGAAYKWQHPNLDNLNVSAVKAARVTLIEIMYSVIGAWPTKLNTCVQHCNDHFKLFFLTEG